MRLNLRRNIVLKSNRFATLEDLGAEVEIKYCLENDLREYKNFNKRESRFL
jgi:hypothetical protein